MFCQYQLRETAGLRSSPAHPASSLSSSQGSTCTSSLSNSFLPSDAVATDFELEPLPSSQPHRHSSPPSDSSLLFEESISSGTCQQRSDPPDDADSDPMQLSPQHVKQLKTYAKDLCSTLEIPKQNLLDFVETGDLFHMLVNMKASLIKYEIDTHANKSNALQEMLTSKDFEISLHNRLLACLLLPNITAYVTDTQSHIMDFIFKHQDIFKIPTSIFDNSELKSSLCSCE
ncbi:hypothetical protein EDC04DRAFT_2894409 [Pisolithus marmoratus]|nr:hypothetical protein EDC04DRAFT_2894409 [Pisolithus marmoratus]